MQIDVTYVDGTDHAAVEAALVGARLFYIESPTSWVMEALDVGALAAMAKKQGVFSVIDNNWATPIFQTRSSWALIWWCIPLRNISAGTAMWLLVSLLDRKRLSLAFGVRSIPIWAGALRPWMRGCCFAVCALCRNA